MGRSEEQTLSFITVGVVDLFRTRLHIRPFDTLEVRIWNSNR
jgi:hypothetical protein